MIREYGNASPNAAKNQGHAGDDRIVPPAPFPGFRIKTTSLLGSVTASPSRFEFRDVTVWRQARPRAYLRRPLGFAGEIQYARECREAAGSHHNGAQISSLRNATSSRSAPR